MGLMLRSRSRRTPTVANEKLMPKNIIPPSEHENVLSVFWALLMSAESSAATALDRIDVEAGYAVLNRIGFTKNRPRWEAKQSTPPDL